MNYKSPIELVETQIRTTIEGEILKAVQNVGVIVDKEELLKALQYDREQYQKGYEDRDLEIVRCKDCKYYDGDGTCMKIGIAMLNNNWFCADGVREE